MAVVSDPRYPRELREMRPEELGGKTSKYTWTQTNWDIRCRVPLDPETMKTDIKCIIQRGHLSLFVFGEAILNGPLCDKVDTEESAWTLERVGKEVPPRLEVNIMLKKVQETQGRNHWNCIVHGEPTIDVDRLGPPIK
ncbi:nudC, partial [Symbiodinium natans]